MKQSICIALFLGMSVSSLVHQVNAHDLVLDSSVLPELARMQAEIDALKANATAPVANVNSICCEPETKKSDYPSVRLTGFFQADSVYFSQDDANLATVGDVQDGADFRRARLAAVGKAWDNVAYQLEMDFAFPGHPSFMDVWLDIENVVGQSHLRIGQFRQPFGMNGQTSVKELPFLERALPFALLPFRQIGAMWYGTGPDELMTYAVSGYRYPTDVYGGSVGDNGGYGLSTRLTGLLVNRDAGVLHAGGGYSFLDPSNDLFQFRNQPEVFVGETGGGVPGGVPTNVPPFIDTGLTPANNANLLNAELALSYRSVYAQSEVFYTRIDQRGGPSVTLPGAYLQGGWILTGEQRTKNGSTTRNPASSAESLHDAVSADRAASVLGK